jgi:hypothetical protein
MSQEDVANMQRVYAALNRGRTGAADVEPIAAWT